MTKITSSSSITLKTGQITSSRPRTIPGATNCTVIARPSAGGVVIGRFTGVELEWLGLPRSSSFSEQPKQQAPAGGGQGSLEEKDALALCIMRLGARWWPSREFEARHADVQYPYGHHYPPVCTLGTLLVLRHPQKDNEMQCSSLRLLRVTRLIGYPEDEPEKQNHWPQLAACGTMENGARYCGISGQRSGMM
ncbi:hypothetical protein DL771_000421 [Monosporascus sp. 5C6A]|nr:hypothetical protein DL771_000421 [Monosporascus sp. 5C6A]